MSGLCSDEEMQALMEAMQGDDGRELAHIDRLIGIHRDDARLHFLRGSVLAGIGRSIEALTSLQRAVELAPDFAIARFQLGFFQLTSGEAANALSTWGPLALLPEDHYLRIFVAGLTHLIRDEFAPAIEQLRRGIELNDENPPLNRDMQLIIDTTTPLLEGTAPQPADGEAASATSFLLGQFTHRGS